MSFLYPLFLLAGLSLAIPVLIHLFNLRRYKTVFFSHTRFLKSIQLKSRKQSQVRYKLLLAARLLFLAFLVAAFAQPFFHNLKNEKTASNLQVIYIDNSASMSLKKGARSLLDIAKDAALNQIHSAAPNSRFLLLTNDKPLSYEPMPAAKVISALNALDIAPVSKVNTQLLATVQSLMQSENYNAADLYYYSDFQKDAFIARPDAALINNITLHAIDVRTAEVTNVFIDTAYLTSPVLQTGQSNQLIVRSRLIGKTPADDPVLQLNINGQIKSAASLSFKTNSLNLDTLNFTVNDAGWQRISLYINDAALRFDDTFRIAARSAPGLSVLVLNEGQQNPYIQAAFRAYSGFRVSQENVNNAPADWKDYNLLIFNGITGLNETVGKHVTEALAAGQSICIFPGKTRNIEGLNKTLQFAGDIHINTFDTAVQTATSLQQGSDLVKDLFEKIPDNVQLPAANWHYSIQSGLTANQQSVLSFRNGDPLFARYRPSRGSLYLSATAADLESGNFTGSYFFVPFLYQMAAQSRSGDVYALTSGSDQPAFMAIHNTDERNMVHVLGNGIDAIPPQRTAGGGMDIFVDAVVQQPDFYRLSAPSGDSAVIALNASRKESVLELWDLDVLKKEWPGKDATWQTPEAMNARTTINTGGSYPLWKVCTIFALVLLAAKTFLLARKTPENVATT